MDLLADTWVMWLVISFVSLGAVYFYRQTRRNESESGSLATAEDFSIRAILFGFRKGEGDLFVGYVIGMVTFSMALAGVVRWATTIF